jgi:hypothetical protein
MGLRVCPRYQFTVVIYTFFELFGSETSGESFIILKFQVVSENKILV